MGDKYNDYRVAGITAATEPAKVVAMAKGISTPETGGGGIFWLGLAAVILGVAIVARCDGRGE